MNKTGLNDQKWDEKIDTFLFLRPKQKKKRQSRELQWESPQRNRIRHDATEALQESTPAITNYLRGDYQSINKKN
jgi:hypothetical protein